MRTHKQFYDTFPMFALFEALYLNSHRVLVAKRLSVKITRLVWGNVHSKTAKKSGKEVSHQPFVCYSFPLIVRFSVQVDGVEK